MIQHLNTRDNINAIWNLEACISRKKKVIFGSEYFYVHLISKMVAVCYKPDPHYIWAHLV